MIKLVSNFFVLSLITISSIAQENEIPKRTRDYGIRIGILPTGKLNAITDVKGVRVGHVTLIQGDSIHTGVTAILPHPENIFQQKVPAGLFIGNGFGKMSGISQIKELGNLESPIILTNTLNVGTAMQAVVKYTLSQPGNETIKSVNAVVGETNDATLNDIRGFHVHEQDVLDAIQSAKPGIVEEGNVGAGTGTVCFGFKGGIGTASRKLPDKMGGYTVGVIVQSNYGGVLQINGVPIGKELRQFSFSNSLLNNVDGSCMVIIATDAPLSDRNLERLATRSFLGLGKTGGIASNGSGEYFLAFSTHKSVRIPHQPTSTILDQKTLHNDELSSLFMAAIEATEEAVINSLFTAQTVNGYQKTIPSLPLDKVIQLMKKHNALTPVKKK